MNIILIVLRTPRFRRWLAAILIVAGLAVAGFHRWRVSCDWVVTDNA